MSDLIETQTDCEQLDNLCGEAVVELLHANDKDLGGFSVRRLLPSRRRPSVGPFIFFDHLGPAEFPPGEGIDVRPHPHIGLATVTYVFQGEILHRDSLGHVQPIRPGEINWMTAGKGIVHSERTGPELRAKGHTLEALQLWLALPIHDEQTDPFFAHYASEALPAVDRDGVHIRVMIGEAYGVRSKVKTHSPTLYVEITLAPGARIKLPQGYDERAAYLVSGRIDVQGGEIAAHTLAIFSQRTDIELVALEETRLVLIGGTPLGKRTLWWNLVSTRSELIEQAKLDWQEQRFQQVPGETERIPLPGSS